jgi:hypothetical protein
MQHCCTRGRLRAELSAILLNARCSPVSQAYLHLDLGFESIPLVSTLEL